MVIAAEGECAYTITCTYFSYTHASTKNEKFRSTITRLNHIYGNFLGHKFSSVGAGLSKRIRVIIR